MYGTLRALGSSKKKVYYFADKDGKVITMLPAVPIWIAGREGHTFNVFISDDTFQIIDEDVKHTREAA